MTSKPWLVAGGTFPLAFLFLFALAGSAHAQWVWRDTSGEITYSDSPPPAEVIRSDILRQPSGGAPATTSVSDATSSAPDAASTPPAPTGSAGTAPPSPPAAAPQNAPASKPDSAPKSLAEQDADFRKRLGEQQKADQKQAEEDSQAAERAGACAQAKSYLEMLEGGTRLLRPDANGDRNFLDDDQRAAEIQKTQETVAKSC
ncbi:conserved exported hypothetical protein [Burkholderiales bacterium]|nr:conserved exported hypothetical protein [Burkholderiales bacterium]